MDWLIALVIALGLAALLGVVWLHMARTPLDAPQRSSRSAGHPTSSERDERSITLSYLRRCAIQYRELAVKVTDPVVGARYWDLGGLLDKAADALESQPVNEQDADFQR